jgi:hypothetical protein
MRPRLYIIIIFFFIGIFNSIEAFCQPSKDVPQAIIDKEYKIHRLVDSISKTISFHVIDSSSLYDQKGFFVGKVYDTIFYDTSKNPIKFIISKIVLNSKFEPRINKYECYFLPYKLNRAEYKPLSISLQEALPSTFLFFEDNNLIHVRGVYKNRNTKVEESLLKEIKKYFQVK